MNTNVCIVRESNLEHEFNRNEYRNIHDADMELNHIDLNTSIYNK